MVRFPTRPGSGFQFGSVTPSGIAEAEAAAGAGVDIVVVVCCVIEALVWYKVLGKRVERRCWLLTRAVERRKALKCDERAG